jgi:hypothetical protein
VPEEPLAGLRELERADEKIGATLVELDQLAAELDETRAKAEELQGFAARLPTERARRLAELERAREEVSAADRTLAQAEEALRFAKSDAAREAELFAVRARDRVSVAERRAAEAAAAVTDLEHEAGVAAVEGHQLHARARKLAAELGARPRIASDAGEKPGAGLEGVQAWGEVARAALFVARGQLSAERDAVIRQAIELGSAALGESLGSASVAVVAKRIEQELPQ